MWAPRGERARLGADSSEENNFNGSHSACSGPCRSSPLWVLAWGSSWPHICPKSKLRVQAAEEGQGLRMLCV